MTKITTHADHRFSVTVHTEDLAVVNCLRALAKYSQKHGNNNIPWGGTTDQNWKHASSRVKFHFSEPVYRDGFLAEAKRLLPAGLWSVSATSDIDPATRQR